MLGAVREETFTHEQRKRLLADIESCFTNTILHMSQEAPHVNREEVLYCICSGLHVTPRRIADCLLTTPSTLRSRKARLSNKLPEYMYGTFFTKRESAC
jgi:DNA-binding CsgD family transcriptional regulator